MKSVLVSTVVLILITSANGHNNEDSMQEVSEKRMIDCWEEGDLQCMKLRALADVYQLLKTKSLQVNEGITVAYSGDRETEVATARSVVDQDWGSLIFNFIPRMMRGLSLKLNIFPGGNLVMSKSQKENGLFDLSIEPDNAAGEARKYN